MEEAESGIVLNAKNLGLEDTPTAAENLGLIAGFSAGGGETYVALESAAGGTASLAQSLYEDPRGTVVALKDQIQAIKQLENWPQYLDAIKQQYESEMRTSNPYDEEEDADNYERFRTNYYAGILLFEVALGFATGGTVQAASKTATASKIATAASGTKIATAANVVTRSYRGVTAPARFAEKKLVSAAVRTGSLTVDGAAALYLSEALEDERSESS